MAKLDYMITDGGAERLCAAILRQAAFDISSAVRARIKYGDLTERAHTKYVRASKFLLSPWGQWLSRDNGEYIIYKATELALATDQRHSPRGKYLVKEGKPYR